jgi:peptide/nickel transport system substrate-binding protein
MKLKALLFMALVVVVASGPGCRRGGERAVAEHKDPHPLPAEPRVIRVKEVGKYGGRFVLGQTGTPRTFNAIMSNESSSGDVTNLAFTSLIDLDNDTQEIIPLLAKSWDVSPDGLTYTFHLRKGAAFSDGHPMTSEDVLFSFQVVYDEALHPSVQDLLKVGGKPFQVSAPDPYTFVVTIPSPLAIVLDFLGAVRIMPKHMLEASFKAGSFASAYNVSTPPDQVVTSGAWRVAQHVPGEKTVLGRNPYWFGVDQENHRLPYLDEIVFLQVPDQDAADLKFRAGELSGLENVKPENYRWYTDHQKEGNYTLYDLGIDMNPAFFWFNLNKVQRPVEGKKPVAGKNIGDPFTDPVKYSWFSNPMFRRAVSHAIDRDAMIPSVLFGEGGKNWAVATAANKLWYNPDLVHYDYNVAESKRLLAAAGFRDSDGDGVIEDPRGNPVSFTIKTNSDNTLRVATANFVKDDLAKVGIKLTLVPLDFNTLITNLRSDFQYDAILLGLQSAIPPDPSMMQNLWRSSGLTHYWFVSQQKPSTPEEARIDRLMDELSATRDHEARKKAYKEVETITNEQGWIVWLPIRNQKLPVSNRFGNVRPSILPHRLLWNSEYLFAK